MAVVLDPHFKEPGNKQTGEAVTPIGTKFPMLVPAYAPFYTTSLVVKSGGKVLTLGDDYVITHPYMTAMLRTGYVSHGMVWIVNPKYYKDFTVDYHAVGNGIATSAQITAERTANADKFPTACQWEEVIGDVYFPPVDIQFDRDNWQGELELMNAIVAIGKKIGQIINLPNPVTNNTFPVTTSAFTDRLDYDNMGKFTFNQESNVATGTRVTVSPSRWDVPGQVKDYVAEFLFDLKGYQTWTGLPNLGWEALKNITKGVGSQEVWFDYSMTDKAWRVYMHTEQTSQKDYNLVLFPFALAKFAQPFTIRVERVGKNVTFILKQNNVVLGKYVLDVTNPPADVLAVFNTYKLQTNFLNPTETRLNLSGRTGDSVTFKSFPGIDLSVDIQNDVYQLMVKYHAIVRKLYEDAPAHDHVGRKDNPHNDSWGAIRALELNGIASDATLVYGKTQAQLADYVNNLLPKLSSLANKLLRNASAAQTLNGTFGTKPGLTAVTSATGSTETNGVGAQFTVDPKAIRFLGRDSQTVNAGNNPITMQSGANQLILYPDSRGLLWNGKKLLDPTTVAPYLPGNSGGGDGLFYGTNTATVTINGNGIQSVPFICTFVPPTSTDVNLLAMRQLTNDFGTAEDLAATPALIAKLDAMFTGKLEKVKAYINDLPLTSSVYIDKQTFSLDKVANLADKDLVVSTLQQAELNKYAVKGHTHTAATFGVKAATATQFGLIQYGLAVDDASLALDGSVVIDQTTTITQLEAVAKGLDSGASIDIIRFGVPGNDQIQNGVQTSGWMVTLAKETYFLGQAFEVPLTTINLTEAFPDAYEDTKFGIFVDVLGDTAFYRILENPDTAETDTMTKVGTIDTSEDGVEIAEIHNVTRLGSFRELEDHIADDNAHIKRTMTMSEFGYTGFGKGGPCWASGVPSNLRGEGDWRMAYKDMYWSMSGMKYDEKNARWVFDPVGISVNDYRFIHHTFPLYLHSDITHTWLSSDVGSQTLMESIIASYRDETNFMNRVSIVFNRGSRVADSNGAYCYAGLAVNFGSGRNVVIGFTPTKFSATIDPWSTISPTLKFSNSRAADGTLTYTCVLTLSSQVYDVVLVLGPTVKTVTCTKRSSGATQTIDLSNRIRPDYIDLSPMWEDSTLAFYQGFGGVFGNTTTASVTFPATAATTYKRFYNGTLLDYLANFSVLNRARFLEFNYVGGDTSLSSLAMTMADAERSLVPQVLPLPTNVNEDRVIAFCQNNLARAVIFRD